MNSYPVPTYGVYRFLMIKLTVRPSRLYLHLSLLRNNLKMNQNGNGFTKYSDTSQDTYCLQKNKGLAICTTTLSNIRVKLFSSDAVKGAIFHV